MPAFYRKRNIATRVTVPLIDSSSRPDYYSGTLTSPTINIYKSGDGNTGTTQTTSGVTVTEKGSTGLWEIYLPQAVMNLGSGYTDMIIKISHSSIDEQTIEIETSLRASMVDLLQDENNTSAFKAIGKGSGNGASFIGGDTGDGLLTAGGASGGSGINAYAQSGNDDGISAKGAGSGIGIYSKGGATGIGLKAEGGDTSGDGLVARSAVAGNGRGFYALGSGGFEGLYAQGSSNAPGIRAKGAGSFPGIKAEGENGILAVADTSSGESGIKAVGDGVGHGIEGDGGANGNGIHGGGKNGISGTATEGSGNGIQGIGGTSSGNGIYGEALTDGSGLKCQGNGVAPGIHAIGGATASGLLAVGGGTSGHGIKAEGSATDGHGFFAEAKGTASGVHGIYGLGKNQGDGLKAVGGSDGAGIHGVATGTSISKGGIWGEVASGQGDGMRLDGGTPGKDINANEIDQIDSVVDSIQIDTNNIETKVDGVKAKTDNLPSDPADQSEVEAAISTSETNVIAEVNANEAKIDALNDVSTAEVQTACDDALDAYDSAGGVAKENSVLAIQNNTRFTTSIAGHYLIPSAGSTVYKLVARFYDGDGSPEDVDDNDVGLDLDTADGTDKNAILYKEFACTNALGNSGFAGHKKLEHGSTGEYFCYIKIASTESVAQFMYGFKLEEVSVEFGYSRTNQVLEDDPATVDANIVEVNSVSVSDIDDFKADVSALASQASVDTIDGNVDSIVAKLPTGTISDFDESTDKVEISGTKNTLDDLNDLSQAGAESACDSSLASYDPPTKAEMDSGFAALNDVSTAEVEAACDASLVSYDPPTKAELDAVEVKVDGVKAKTDDLNFNGDGTAKLLVDIRDVNDVAVSDIDDFKADVSGLASQASVDTIDGNVDSILADTTAILVDTGTDIPALIAALNDLSEAQVKDQIDAALDTDSGTELGIGVPAKDAPLREQIQLLFMALRNKKHQTSNLYEIYDDAGVVISKAALAISDAEVTRDKLVAG